MVILKTKSQENKGYQHYEMVWDCIDHWYIINNSYTRYSDVMNMETYRFNDEHHYFVSLTYHFNPNKW